MKLYDKINGALRARVKILYIISYEEAKVESIIANVCSTKKMEALSWSLTSGLKNLLNNKVEQKDPLSVLRNIQSANNSGTYILKDYHAFLDDIQITRLLKDIYYEDSNKYTPIIIVSPILKIPPELDKVITVVDSDLPVYNEIREYIQEAYTIVKSRDTNPKSLSNKELDELARACQGLTEEEISYTLATSFAQTGNIDIKVILENKKQIIRKTEILEYFDSVESFESVGGMDVLKDWCKKRSTAFSEEAQAFGLPLPKGLLLLGSPGSGKSHLCKCLASLWQVPLLRFDVGRVMSGRVGSSEYNIRRVIKLAESVSPCILFIDEIEKAFSGVASSNFSDAGTTSRVFSTFIQWLNDKQTPVFVVATANSVTELPPELIRKGRFDELFFIDLPNAEERSEIFKIHLEKRKRHIQEFDIDTLSEYSVGFSGAEIENAIVEALYDAFSVHHGGKDITTADITKALRSTVPISKLSSEKITALREWAKGRTRFASS